MATDEENQRHKDDWSQCPPRISSKTKDRLKNEEGYDESNAHYDYLDKLVNDPDCPLVVPIEKLDKSCSFNTAPQLNHAGIRGELESIPSDADGYDAAQQILNASWDYDSGEVEIGCSV